MQIDQLLHAITVLTTRIGDSTCYTVEGKYKRLQILSHLRHIALHKDALYFSNYCSNMLSTEPDVMPDLLGDLWAELGLAADCTWEEFAEKFLK